MVELSVKWGIELDTYVDNTLPGQIECWAKYIYLDDQERQMMVASPQKYLIEQVQHNGVREVSTDVGKSHLVDLDFRHPVKDIVWCHPNTTGDGTTHTLWNMTHLAVTAAVGAVGATSGVSPQQCGGVVLASTAWSEDQYGTCGEASIQLNGQDVAINQSGTVFNQVQSYYGRDGCPVPGIYSYSFALKPAAYQPSGTCNFSRIDNGTLRFRIIDNAAATHNKVSIFATNYNIMNISAGMASLSFSN